MFHVPDCHMRWFTPSEACSVIDLYEKWYFIGDQNTRELIAGIFGVLTGDFARGMIRDNFLEVRCAPPQLPAPRTHTHSSSTACRAGRLTCASHPTTTAPPLPTVHPPGNGPSAARTPGPPGKSAARVGVVQVRLRVLRLCGPLQERAVARQDHEQLARVVSRARRRGVLLWCLPLSPPTNPPASPASPSS